MKKSYFATIAFCILLGSAVFAENDWFGYTSLNFDVNGNTYPSLFMSVVVGTGISGFNINIDNSSDESVTLALDFAYQIQTDDGLNNRTCDLVNGRGLANYLNWNKSPFVVNPNSVFTRRVDLDLPACYSGKLLGCAIQYNPNDISLDDMDLYVGKVSFWDIDVSPSDTCLPFQIKVYPGSRPGLNYINVGELSFYDQNKQFVISGVVTSNQYGSGIFNQSISSGLYYVFYKGQSHLASYLSGVSISEGGESFLDFTTGSGLYNAQNKSLLDDDGSKYQIAGDLKNIEGRYDFTINGNDISSIVYLSGFVEGGVAVLDPKNLNADDSINGADISIVGINFQQLDPFASNSLFNW